MNPRAVDLRRSDVGDRDRDGKSHEWSGRDGASERPVPPDEPMKDGDADQVDGGLWETTLCVWSSVFYCVFFTLLRTTEPVTKRCHGTEARAGGGGVASLASRS